MVYEVASRERLKKDLVRGAVNCVGPFSVAELVAEVGGNAARSTVDRALSELCAAGLMTQVRKYPQRRYVLGRPEPIDAADPAPDWGRGYPSGGGVIGPMWQAMWRSMDDGAWHDVRDLLVVADLASGGADKTARNLLFAAAKAGHIEPEARQDEKTGRWRIWYRRPDRATGGA